VASNISRKENSSKVSPSPYMASYAFVSGYTIIQDSYGAKKREL